VATSVYKPWGRLAAVEDNCAAPLLQELWYLEISSGLCTLTALGPGLSRVCMEGERTSRWLCFKSVVLLLGDTESMNLGSAAGIEPVVLREKSFA